MTEHTAELVNRQMNGSYALAFSFLACADFYHSCRLHGFANWFEVEAKREMDCAMMLRSLLHQNGEAAKIRDIGVSEQPAGEIGDPIREVPKRLQQAGALLEETRQEAKASGDACTLQFLGWFVRELSTREREAEGLEKRFLAFGGTRQGRDALNRELMARAYQAPALVV